MKQFWQDLKRSSFKEKLRALISIVTLLIILYLLTVSIQVMVSGTCFLDRRCDDYQAKIANVQHCIDDGKYTKSECITLFSGQ